jgi:type I restriction enzyme S subunit
MSGDVAVLDHPVDHLPGGWAQITLGGALAKSEGGGTPPRDVEEYWNGDIPWASVKDVVKGEGSKPEETITPAGLVNSTSKLIPAGTNIFAARMGVGAVVRYPFPVAINQDLMALTPSSELDPSFLFYWLQARKDAFVAVATGTTVKGIRKDVLLSFPILLPPLDEQRRIAEVLRSVDEAIAANEATLRQRDRVRKGFSSLFHRGLGHSEFQSSCIGEIPASWHVGTMKDVCHNVGVGIASSATHAYVEQGVPLLRNQNIKPGHLDLDDLLFVNEDYDQSYAPKRVRTGDIITMRTGYPGRSAVIPPELDGCQTFTTLISRPKVAVVDPLFLCEWINSEPGMVEIRKRQAGGAQQNLNAGAMQQVPVPLPPMEEQRHIASILRNFPTEDDALIAKLRTVRKLMQADLLSGRVRVPA